ncbi:hypothetical protein CHELA1G11_13059 [Hyphomicrobiales bacterium]|nr:hypothetical protein CHELA1G2_11250 [Hyphomicrobiales bacterium]CAH1669017.1 hypothetical protein CHELA1G11_13059 [Hyphomicrobiales bacterium]
MMRSRLQACFLGCLRESEPYTAPSVALGQRSVLNHGDALAGNIAMLCIARARHSA